MFLKCLSIIIINTNHSLPMRIIYHLLVIVAWSGFNQYMGVCCICMSSYLRMSQCISCRPCSCNHACLFRFIKQASRPAHREQVDKTASIPGLAMKSIFSVAPSD